MERTDKEELLRAIALGTGDLDHYQRLATLLLDEGDHEGLLTLWRECPFAQEGSDVDRAWVAYELGQALFLLGRTDEAGANFIEAADLADTLEEARGSELPAYARYFACKSIVGADREQGLVEAQKSIDAFLRFLDRDADYATALEAHSYLGELYALLGDDTKSLAFHRRYLALADDGDAENRLSSLIGVAEALRRTGETAAAMTTLDEALAIAPSKGEGRSGILIGQALISYDRGAYAEAREMLEAAIDSAGFRQGGGAHTVVAEAEIHLAAVSLREGAPRKALSLIDVGVRSLPEKHPLRIHARLVAASCRATLREPEKAAPLYQSIIDDPGAEADQRREAQAGLASLTEG